MGMLTFNLMRMRQEEKMKPENIKRTEEEKLAKSVLKEEIEEKHEEEPKVISPIKRKKPQAGD